MKKTATANRTPLNRRQFIKQSSSIAAFSAPMVNFGRFQVSAATERTYSAKAIELVNRSLVIDMLSILADLDQVFTAGYSANAARLDAFAIPPAHVQKLRTTGVDIFHPAVGVGGHEEALAFVARLNAYAAEYPSDLCRIDAVADMEKAKAQKKMGYIIGIQNADHFRTADDVNKFYHLGQRVGQLTYNSRNLIGTGATDRSDGGLSDFGVAIIERMNDIGMAVDVSHCGDRTTLDAFEVSKKPVLITHSNVRALADGHPRCKSDEAIIAMAKSESVMGITGVRNFIRASEPTTIEHMLDHYDYVVKLAGVEHVGIGTDVDADGYDDISKSALQKLKDSYKGSYGFRKKLDTDGFDHPLKIFDLTEGLIRRGYSDQNIELILGGNFKRVLNTIWA